MPPHLLLFLVAVAVSAVLLSRSPLGKLLSAGLPFAALVGFQGFRILAELALWSAHKEGLAPVQMTFEGLNFDILSGISAFVLAPWLARRPSRPVIWAWNFGALALLLVIVGIAALSAPTPLRQFMNEPANTFVARFPYVLLPGVLVFAALVGHLLVFRKLRTPAN